MISSSRVSTALLRTTTRQSVLRRRCQASAVTSNAGRRSASSKSKSSSSESSAKAPAAVPVAKSLFAAALGVGTVASVAAIVENATASSVPEFSPSGQRFDQGTFAGRFCRMTLACDPRLLFYTEEQVRDSQKMVENYRDYPKEMAHALWEARRITEAALHPDTGEDVPRPFRMSGYVPFNGPICVAMVAAPNTLSLLFFSWVNQSQNALVNYFNRNASSPMSNETLAYSYGAAVGSALLVAFGASQLIQRRFEPARAKQLLRFAAFPSSVVASSANCYIVRSPELETGIPLLNEDHEEVLPGAVSHAAASAGVASTVFSRAVLQAPVYFLPPLLMSTIGPLKRYLAAHPAMSVPITTYLVLVAFGVGLPASVAIFPQISSISADRVEERFQHLREPKTNQPYKEFYFNKGL